MAARKRTRDFLDASQPKISSAANEVRVARLTTGEVLENRKRLRGRRRTLLERSDCGLMIIAINGFGIVGLWVDPYRCEQDKCITLADFSESLRRVFGDPVGNSGLGRTPCEFTVSIIGDRGLVDE
jgi:hypothetical protein